MGRKAVDLTGETFGRLRVICKAEKTDSSNRAYWRCICDCGQETVVASHHLRQGDTISCGCYGREHLITHGLRYTRLYRVWYAMLQRCNNPNDRNYHHYGGRGITVCDEWRDAATFLAWANATCHDDSLTLDRADNNRGYSPDNCRWVTRTIQGRNQRTSKRNTSGARGVYWDERRSRWRVRISLDGGKKKHLGDFRVFEDAISARLAAEQKYWESTSA